MMVWFSPSWCSTLLSTQQRVGLLWMDDRGSEKMEDAAGERRKDDRVHEGKLVDNKPGLKALTDMVSVVILTAKFDGMDVGHMAGTLLIEDVGASESEAGGTTREGINRATIRPPPEPPPGIERGARVQDSYFAYLVFLMLCLPPMSFFLWILVTVYVARFASLFGFLAFFVSLGMFGSMGIRVAVSSPIHG
ncbi:unnamed protein product [Cuscuta epithymum]|uniref:Uncharacterized protein n=1 Tax=Cuscuta epithymum TaxID=186058 RepID=A0AAV0FHU6_9ASTE|nr:unnamed protein product [Cuscuta epithymum]